MICKLVMKLMLVCFALIVPASSTLASEATYGCADGTLLRAAYGTPGAGSVRLTLAGRGRYITLPQVISADGGRYARGGTEFWIKGNTARLTRAGVTLECKTQ